MPYIGTPAVDRFTSTKSASVFSGDGSTTAFTLDHAVGSDEDILVSVDGVVQEPSVAYAVSNGTTLTFTAAPSSNSGNNIFVYYLFRTVGTVGHPSNQALSATTGTFTGTLAVTGATTLSSDVTIGDASAADKKILFDGNAQDFHIGLDDSADSLTIGLGSTLGTTSHMIFDANGHITKPLQPAFQVQPSSDQTNVDDNDTIAFGYEEFDQNGDFSSNQFTAPVTGKYLLTASVRVDNVDTAANWVRIEIITSNQDYKSSIIDVGVLASDPNYWSFSQTVLADMDANDTAKIQFGKSGGAVQSDINQGDTFFSGHLVC
jgi:hypothetical protein